MILNISDKGVNILVENASEVRVEKAGVNYSLSYTTSLGQFKVLKLKKDVKISAWLNVGEGGWHDLKKGI